MIICFFETGAPLRLAAAPPPTDTRRPALAVLGRLSIVAEISPTFPYFNHHDKNR
eukprot:COSAG01_NODE_2533_length_7491_cov_236.560741_4_plen_55_part_00